ncbi:hypothetical protein GOP47_0019456 [Adiantum capillus-veneris]|uniref:Uncharacterized protein n=1 Tax=Adiantum capillus-veneris TaxID=13818 RepID=A0A9D4UB36_ADICA|nr:hypothetical protein GOP47_0019456 [Adiantum capillus-veneris]
MYYANDKGASAVLYMHFVSLCICSGFPPAITRLCQILAQHRGLVEKIKNWLIVFETVYDLKPDVELLTCVIDLLELAGHLKKAVEDIFARAGHLTKGQLK